MDNISTGSLNLKLWFVWLPDGHLACVLTLAKDYLVFMLLIWVHLPPYAKVHMDEENKLWKQDKFLSSVWVLTSLWNNLQMQPEGVVDIGYLLLSTAAGEEATDTKACLSLPLSFIWCYNGRSGEEKWSYCQSSVGSWETSGNEMVVLELFTLVIITSFLIGNAKKTWEIYVLFFVYLFVWFFL